MFDWLYYRIRTNGIISRNLFLPYIHCKYIAVFRNLHEIKYPNVFNHGRRDLFKNFLYSNLCILKYNQSNTPQAMKIILTVFFGCDRQHFLLSISFIISCCKINFICCVGLKIRVINFHFPLRCSNTLFAHVGIAFHESYIVVQNLQATIAFRSFPLKSDAFARFQCCQITWCTRSVCVHTSSQLRLSFVPKIIFFLLKSHQLIRTAYTLMVVDFTGTQICDFGKIEFRWVLFSWFSQAKQWVLRKLRPLKTKT